MTLLLEQARTIVRAALEKRVEMGLRPLAIAVLDERGALVAYEQEDGSTLLREKVARGKAMGALGMGMSSRRLGEMGNERPMFMQALIDASGGQLVPVPGGVVVRTADGHGAGAGRRRGQDGGRASLRRGRRLRRHVGPGRGGRRCRHRGGRAGRQGGLGAASGRRTGS